ncbi:hypothetical protein GOBAR_AA13380 [Gossypium barbadense]|uniref:Uncharacterized protein n=1 Tax=Gossypium barbadense TaxID=3634 RepID=A0A2P5XVD0_GOSBA|nr:hypothetical protein GOBAR_AA13380 [Gossypium barbadense]
MFYGCGLTCATHDTRLSMVFEAPAHPSTKVPMMLDAPARPRAQGVERSCSKRGGNRMTHCIIFYIPKCLVGAPPKWLARAPPEWLSRAPPRTSPVVGVTNVQTCGSHGQCPE